MCRPLTGQLRHQGDTHGILLNAYQSEVHAPVLRRPKTLMPSIMAPWPFYQWGMDILGPLPQAAKKLKFFIVAIDYFIKWIEAKPLARITGKDVKKFVRDNIVETPFILTYESEAVIPAEIGMPTHRTMKIREDENEDELRINMDLLQERREASTIRKAKYKTKMEQYYNQKVRPMSFKPDECVFRRNEASRVEDQGKLGSKWERPYRVIEAYQNGFYKLQIIGGKEVFITSDESKCQWPSDEHLLEHKTFRMSPSANGQVTNISWSARRYG
ncbi:reverse transcriptase domain-containing protein [Tanacetum coccineum]